MTRIAHDIYGIWYYFKSYGMGLERVSYMLHDAEKNYVGEYLTKEEMYEAIKAIWRKSNAEG